MCSLLFSSVVDSKSGVPFVSRVVSIDQTHELIWVVGIVVLQEDKRLEPVSLPNFKQVWHVCSGEGCAWVPPGDEVLG